MVFHSHMPVFVSNDRPTSVNQLIVKLGSLFLTDAVSKALTFKTKQKKNKTIVAAI